MTVSLYPEVGVVVPMPTFPQSTHSRSRFIAEKVKGLPLGAVANAYLRQLR